MIERARRWWNDPMLRTRARLWLRLCTEIVDKIPARSENALTKIVKVGSIVDAVNKVVNGQSGAMHGFALQLGLVERTSEHFVTLFFETVLHESFKVRRLSLSEYEKVVEAKCDSIGALYFVEYNWGNAGYMDTFYHSPEFDFERAVALLWASYEGRLHMSIKTGKDEPHASFDNIPLAGDMIYGSTERLVTQLIERHGRYKRDQIPRTYLFVGRPGTGKSTAAVQIAETHGHRLLQITAQSFEHVDERETNFLLKALEPDFIVIDDLDKANVEVALPTVLGILQRFKRSHPGLSVVLTANDETKLDEAVLRPGRVDRVVRFLDPDAEDRTQILRRYLADVPVLVTDEGLARIVEKTEGFTGAWLREIALALRYDPVEEVLTLVQEMRSLIELARGDKEKKSDSKDKPTSAGAS